MAASTGADSTRAGGLYIREWRPASPPRGAFLLLHGMESHSGWFTELASRLVGDGWAVTAYDRAGWGRSPGPRGHLPAYRHFLEEASLMAGAVRDKYGSVHLAGMSWGGMAALYLCLRRSWLFDSLTLIAPGLAARRDIPFSGKVRVARDFFSKNTASQVVPVFRPEDFSRLPSWREFIETDPDRVRSVSTAFCIETLKMRRFITENAGRRRLPPSLCLLAGTDAIISNAKAEAVCHSAGIRTETIADSAHSLVLDQPGETAARMSRLAAAGRDTDRRPVWVTGAGAVGGAVASLLSFGDRQVGVLVKPSHLAALRQNGITLRTGSALRSTGSQVVFADSAAALPPDPAAVVFAVKSFDTEQVLRDIAPYLPEQTAAVSLQNGLGNEDRIRAALPANTVIAGSICASLELAAPGTVIWADDRGGLAAACHSGDAELARSSWEAIFPATGMECTWTDGVNASQRLKWSKLMLNIGFNALNSVTGMSSAALLRDPEYGTLAVQALREGFALMRRLSLEPVDLPGFPVSKMRLLLKAPSPLVRAVMSWQAGRAPEAAFSMRQDIVKKRQHTEIQELNGMIVQVGRRFGCDFTANQKLAEMVENYE